MAWFRTLSGSAGGGGQVVVVPEISGLFGATNGLKLVNGRHLSGFSSTALAYYPLTDAAATPSFNMSNKFKIHLKVKASALLTRSQAIIGNSAGFYNQPSIEFQNSSGSNLFWAGFSTNGSSWTASLGVTKSEIPFVADQWYTVDYEWNNGTFTLTVSDGTNTQSKTAATAHFYQSYNGRVQLGTVNTSSSHYSQNVTYDLADCYWEENDVIVWGNKES